MNKRIKKKREKLRVYHAGDRTFTHKEIAMINKAHIGYINTLALYHRIKEPKFTRPRSRALINYIYKNRTKYFKQMLPKRWLINTPRRTTAKDIFNYRASITEVSE